ncbi:hypothetical protein Patl1_08878 [Pistacia atlantica]|uniref:Uncharacterized protein n=1 Tax=Pistacia atlantica TaxID=434234 RepID=A0ACC1AHD2_9ROSI|nr:hypothetical protein Patl1_08878 [Pistacia atlantica]
MKRTFLDSPVSGHDPKMKKVKQTEEEEEQVNDTGFMDLDENLLFEVLKHADAKTLATAACVNKQWYKTSQDERLWELICTRHLANVGCGNQQLRSVVLALGGFRRLHSLYLCQLSRPTKSTVSPSTSTSTSTSTSSFSIDFGSNIDFSFFLELGAVPSEDRLQAAGAVGKRRGSSLLVPAFDSVL